jgi:RNA polymerase sigma-70 factor (ECF subfamily)
MPDNAVIQQLVDSHRQFLSFLQKRVESREVAEDILQSAFVRSLEHAPELRDDESAVAWFYRMLRNATIDYYRRRDSTQRAYEGWGKEVVLHELPDADAKNEICSVSRRWLPH